MGAKFDSCRFSKAKQTEALEKANAAVEKAAQTLDDNRRDKSSARNIDDLEKDVEKKGAIVKRIEKEIENRKNVERMIEVVKVNMKQAVPYRRMPYEQKRYGVRNLQTKSLVFTPQTIEFFML